MVPKRFDRFGVLIDNEASVRRWKVSFRDTVFKGTKIDSVKDVESYKDYNKMDEEYALDPFEKYLRDKRKKE